LCREEGICVYVKCLNLLLPAMSAVLFKHMYTINYITLTRPEIV
jgi:hypothetical protein